MKAKKFIPMIIAAALTAFAFTGCEDAMIGPEDTWCMTTQTVAGNELNCYFFYNTTSKVIDDDKTLEPGITILIQPTAASSNKFYAMKTFAKGVSVEVPAVTADTDSDTSEDAGTSIKFTASGTTWDLIFAYFYKKGFSANQTTTAPTVLTAEGYKSVDDITELIQDVTSSAETLSWKKILKSLLSSWLDA